LSASRQIAALTSTDWPTPERLIGRRRRLDTRAAAYKAAASPPAWKPATGGLYSWSAQGSEFERSGVAPPGLGVWLARRPLLCGARRVERPVGRTERADLWADNSPRLLAGWLAGRPAANQPAAPLLLSASLSSLGPALARLGPVGAKLGSRRLCTRPPPPQRLTVAWWTNKASRRERPPANWLAQAAGCGRRAGGRAGGRVGRRLIARWRAKAQRAAQPTCCPLCPTKTPFSRVKTRSAATGGSCNWRDTSAQREPPKAPPARAARDKRLSDGRVGPLNGLSPSLSLSLSPFARQGVPAAARSLRTSQVATGSRLQAGRRTAALAAARPARVGSRQVWCNIM